MKPNPFEGLSVYRPPLVFELTGRQFKLVFDDGYDRVLVFKDRKTLSFGKEGEEKEYSYDCLKVADRCYFVNFEDRSLIPRIGYTLVLDLVQDLVTMARASIYWHPTIPKMPSINFVFGGIEREDGTVPSVRHGYTADLAGKSIDWNYGSFNIAHVYATERYYRVAFTPRALARIIRNNPARFERSEERPPERREPMGVYEDYGNVIKIRENIYLVGLLETMLARRNGHGNSLLVLMNLEEMHDVGRSFGTNNDGEDENYTFGAFGDFYDASDVLSRTNTDFIR